MGRPAKISDEDSVKIRKSIKKGDTVRSQSRKYRVSRTTINRIRKEDYNE
jgi:hypothetical protein